MLVDQNSRMYVREWASGRRSGSGVDSGDAVSATTTFSTTVVDAESFDESFDRVASEGCEAAVPSPRPLRSSQSSRSSRSSRSSQSSRFSRSRSSRVDSASTFPPDEQLAPVDRIVELAYNNVFRCCFMFGDFFGQNCEDAYVFNSEARPRLDNMVQLKLNFYRSDKLLVSMDTLRFHFEPNVTVYSSGAVFYFGSLFSCHRLSFGSTFVHVKTIRISDSLWLYKFYYINNASYLREGELIFQDYPEGCQFVECESRDGRYNSSRGASSESTISAFESSNSSTISAPSTSALMSELDGLGSRNRVESRTHDSRARSFSRLSDDARIGGSGGCGSASTIRSSPLMVFDSSSSRQTERDAAAAIASTNRSGAVSFCSVLERECETRNGMIRVHFRMTNKQIRFLVQLRNVRSVQKWQNSCGNKGVSACLDLSDLYTLNGGRVHVIVSAYSTIGRQLVAQILEQFSRAGSSVGYENGRHLQPVFSRAAGGKQVGWCGYGDFFFSCDSPHDTIIVSSPSYGNNATRMCNMTYYAAIGNNLSTWIANRSANHVNYRNNPINGMPLNISRCLSVYHHYNRQLYARNLLVREYRRKRKDRDELALRGISSALPQSFPSAVAVVAPSVSSASASAVGRSFSVKLAKTAVQ